MTQATSKAALSLYALDPAMPVLLRPDGAVQVGWDPRRAVLVRPPRGLAAAELATPLRSPTPISELRRHGVDRGLQDTDGLAGLVVSAVRDAGPRAAQRLHQQLGQPPAAVDPDRRRRSTLLPHPAEPGQLALRRDGRTGNHDDGNDHWNMRRQAVPTAARTG